MPTITCRSCGSVYDLDAVKAKATKDVLRANKPNRDTGPTQRSTRCSCGDKLFVEINSVCTQAGTQSASMKKENPHEVDKDALGVAVPNGKKVTL